MEIVAIIIGIIIGQFFPSYLRKKGENQATKEDIHELTTIVENIKSENSMLLEEIKNKNNLRTLAAEKRLEVHQAAFYQWKLLVRALHTDEISAKVIECQEFWNQNCLYLSPKARQAFYMAYMSASNHANILDVNRGVKGGSDSVRENFKAIVDAGDLIISSIELPPLSEVEKSDLPPENPA